MSLAADAEESNCIGWPRTSVFCRNVRGGLDAEFSSGEKEVCIDIGLPGKFEDFRDRDKNVGGYLGELLPALLLPSYHV